MPPQPQGGVPDDRGHNQSEKQRDAESSTWRKRHKLRAVKVCLRNENPKSEQAGPNGQLAIAGGPFQWLNTIEYLFPITADDSLRGVVFTDFGTVESNVSINNMRVAPGFGLRITLPAMGPAPIALDFAVPVAKAPFDSEQLFSFFVGFAR